MWTGLAAALVLSAGAASPPAGLLSRAALIDAVVRAYGGPAALAAAGAFRERGSVTSAMHPDGAGSIERDYARPGRLRVVTRYPDAGEEVRIVDGARGWDGGVPASGPMLTAMRLQAARLDLPALLDASRPRVRDGGVVALEGRTLQTLVLDLGDGLSVRADVDPGTGRILQTTVSGPWPGGTMDFVTRYADFRKVGGVLFAFEERSWANGSPAGEAHLEQVEVLPALPQATFRP